MLAREPGRQRPAQTFAGTDDCTHWPRHFVPLRSTTVIVLCSMKTAVSIPHDIFEGAERAAKALSLSRSELYAIAVASQRLDCRRQLHVAALDNVKGFPLPGFTGMTVRTPYTGTPPAVIPAKAGLHGRSYCRRRTSCQQE